MDDLKNILNNKFFQVILAVLVAVAVGVVVLMAFVGAPEDDVQPDTGSENNKPVKSSGPKYSLVLKKNISVEDSSVFKSRDIFDPLTGSQTQTSSASSTTTSTSSIDDPAEGKTNSNSSSSNSSSSNSTSSSSGSNTSSSNSTISLSWLKLESKSDSSAIIKYDKTGAGSDIKTYEVDAGQSFADSFMLLGLSSDTAVVLNGDERIELKLGEVKYI